MIEEWGKFFSTEEFWGQIKNDFDFFRKILKTLFIFNKDSTIMKNNESIVKEKPLENHSLIKPIVFVKVKEIPRSSRF